MTLIELTDTMKTQLRNLHTDYTVSLRNVEVALVSIEQAGGKPAYHQAEIR